MLARITTRKKGNQENVEQNDFLETEIYFEDTFVSLIRFAIKCHPIMQTTNLAIAQHDKEEESALLLGVNNTTWILTWPPLYLDCQNI